MMRCNPDLQPQGMAHNEWGSRAGTDASGRLTKTVVISQQHTGLAYILALLEWMCCCQTLVQTYTGCIAEVMSLTLLNQHMHVVHLIWQFTVILNFLQHFSTYISDYSVGPLLAPCWPQGLQM